MALIAQLLQAGAAHDTEAIVQAIVRAAHIGGFFGLPLILIGLRRIVGAILAKIK